MSLDRLHDLVSAAPLACHQIPERSLRFSSGAYFPICARCTGVFIGQMFALAYIGLQGAQFSLYFVLLTLPLLIDWVIQYSGLRQSTNIRRVVTGTIGGFGLGILYYSFAVFCVEFLLRFTKLV